MKVVWAILCESAVTDRDTNRVSLFNVIEDIMIHTPPPTSPTESDRQYTLVPMKFEMVVLWARSNSDEPEHGEGRYRIVGPGDQELDSEEFEVDLTQHLRLRGHHQFSSLPYWNEGIYSLKLEYKPPNSVWQELFELPLRVEVQTDES